MTDGYFPYDVEQDLTRLGLVYSRIPTRLGRLCLARPSTADAVDTLFLHGVGLDSSAWSPLVQAAGGRAPAGWALLDLPGFGGSAPLEGGLTLDEASDAVVDVLDALGARQVDVVGHSMGGFLALHLGARHPGRVRSLSVVCGTYSTIVDVVNAPLHTLRRAPRTAMTYLGLTALARMGGLGTRLLGAGARTGVLRLSLPGIAAHPMRVRSSMLRAMAAGNRPASFSFAQATGTGYDYRAVWSRIPVPVTAIFGESDALVTRRDADVLAAVLPDARIAYVADAGHLAPMERPDALLGLVFPAE